MNRFSRFIILVFAVHITYADETQLKWDFSISPLEWSFDAKNQNRISIIWSVKNTSAKNIVLPIGNQTILEIRDQFGGEVGSISTSDMFRAFTAADYLCIAPGLSMDIPCGKFILFNTKTGLRLGTKAVRGGHIDYGPLRPGGYTIRGVFDTKLDPSKYAKAHFELDDIWLGSVRSNWISVVVK